MAPETLDDEEQGAADKPTTIAEPHTASETTNTAIEAGTRTLESLSIKERLSTVQRNLRNGKSIKAKAIVDHLLKTRKTSLTEEEITKILGEGRISAGNKLAIMGIENIAFQEQNLSFRRGKNGEMVLVIGNPRHKPGQKTPETKAKLQPPQEPKQPDPRTPYTPPEIESIEPNTDITLKAKLLQEILEQLKTISLATREEIHAVLVTATSNGRIVNNTQGGVTRNDGTPVNTMIHLLEKFEENPVITHEELLKGFKSPDQLKYAIGNMRNNDDNVIFSNGLSIEPTKKGTRDQNKKTWRIESRKVVHSDSTYQRAEEIHKTTQSIRNNDLLFADAPRFSQFIVGALTDLPLGATLEEFSVVTGLSEEDILKAVNHVNTSVIPGKTNLKIHNRNGVLIFGEKNSVVHLINNSETYAETQKWKAIVAEIRAKIEAVTGRQENPTIIEDTPTVEPETIADLKKLASTLENRNIKGATRTFLEKLLVNNGEIPEEEIRQIQKESGSKTQFSAFITNARQTLIPRGLTLVRDKANKTVKLETIGQDQEKPVAAEPMPAEPDKPAEEPTTKVHTTETPKDTVAILTRIIEHDRTSEPSKKLLQALIDHPEGISRDTLNKIVKESGMKSHPAKFIFHINRPLKKHGLVITKYGEIVRLESIGQNQGEPVEHAESAKPAKGESTEPRRKGPFKLKINHEAMLDLMTERVEELQAELERTQTELATLKKDSTKAASLLETAETKIRNLTTQSGEARTTIRALEVQLDEKSSELQRSKGANTALTIKSEKADKAVGEANVRASNAQQREQEALARALAAEQESAALRKATPAPELLARVRAAQETIEGKEARIRELAAEIETLKETMKQVRTTTMRNAKHEARTEITAEFAEQLAKKDAEIKDLKKAANGLNARIASLESRANRPASEQAAALQVELAQVNVALERATRRAETAEARATAKEEKTKTAAETSSATSSETLASAQKEITDLKAKLLAAAARATAAESQPKTVIQTTTVVGPTSSTEFLASKRLEATEARATTAETRATNAERSLKTSQEETARLRTQLEAAQKAKPAEAAPAPKLKSPAQETLEALREAKKTISSLEKQIEDLKHALQDKKSHIIVMEEKGGIEKLRVEVKTLKAENTELKRTQAQAIESQAGISQLDITIRSLRNEVQRLKQELADAEKRATDTGKKAEELQGKLNAAEKEKKGKGAVAKPETETKEMSPEARAAEEKKVAATLKANKGKVEKPALKELTKFTEKVKTTTTIFPVGLTETILGDLNELTFSLENLKHFVTTLETLQQAISENKALARDPRTREASTKLQTITKFIKDVLSLKNDDFTPERKGGMIRRINQLLG